MTPINLLSESISDLWWMSYSIIAGWGASFTIIVAVLIVVVIKLIRLNHRIEKLENRLVMAERDYNLSITQHKSK
jgi:hypothetical protein